MRFTRPLRRVALVTPVVLALAVVVVACGGKIYGEGDCSPIELEVDTSDLERSCQQDSDCTIVSIGKSCDGACGCVGAAVNASGAAMFHAATASLEAESCSCLLPVTTSPSLLAVTTSCLQGVCTFCQGGAPLGCPAVASPCAPGGCQSGADAGK